MSVCLYVKKFLDFSSCGWWDRVVNYQTNFKNAHQFEIDKFLLKTNNFLLFVEQLTVINCHISKNKNKNNKINKKIKLIKKNLIYCSSNS